MDSNKTEAIKKELRTTTGYSQYNGWNNNRTQYGYHSYNIHDININGQRNPKQRLDIYRKYVDFSNKTVCDFGCNVGAMLHHLPEIKQGIGFDYDNSCIKAGNNISKILNCTNVNLYTHDFDKDPYKNLIDLIQQFNISFLLSLGSWVSSWQTLYSIAIDHSDIIILETNNIKEGQSQLNFFEKKNKNIQLISENSLDDITNNTKRQSFLISS